MVFKGRQQQSAAAVADRRQEEKDRRTAITATSERARKAAGTPLLNKRPSKSGDDGNPPKKPKKRTTNNNNNTAALTLETQPAVAHTDTQQPMVHTTPPSEVTEPVVPGGAAAHILTTEQPGVPHVTPPTAVDGPEDVQGTVAGVGTNPQKPNKERQKRVKPPQEISDSVKRLAKIAGYDGKVGVDGIGCEHYGLEQMRQSRIGCKKDLVHYLQKDKFLHESKCHICEIRADDPNITKHKSIVDQAWIYYCEFDCKLQKDGGKCPWYCTPCFDKEVIRENEAMIVQNGGSTKRIRRTCQQKN